jgi:hypothetical protein
MHIEPDRHRQVDLRTRHRGGRRRCWGAVEKDSKIEKYATLPGYANGLPMVARRYCGLWGRGT